MKFGRQFLRLFLCVFLAASYCQVQPVDCEHGDLSCNPGFLLLVLQEERPAPDDLPGLVLWLQAGRGITESSNLVSAWTDADRGRTAQESTNQPTYVADGLNGLPTVRFSGGQILGLNNFVSLGGFSIFTVWSAVPPASQGIIYELGPNTNTTDGFYFETQNCIGLVRRGGVNTGYQMGSGLGADGNPMITSQQYDGTHGGHEIYQNGTSLSGDLTNCVAGNDPGTATVTDGFYIGSRTGLAFPFSGDISELIVYDSPYAEYRNPVVCYLSDKYGISVSEPCD